MELKLRKRFICERSRQVQIWEWSGPITIVANIAAWFILHFSISYLFTVLPDRWFDGLRLTASSKELSFYDRVLHIKRWKNRLPDGAVWIGQDFRKQRIQRRDTAYLHIYQREAHRGEWCHYVSIMPVPLFFLWNMPAIAWGMVVYALAANVPCILSLRYNRARIVRILQRREEVIPAYSGKMRKDPSMD
ncbi:glycosyl-4,4'-diaponeurosporenoate acyltransferase CrtO family protein [Paenibacillus gallinarum]|uniref:glycosyl-4,4'-diaponeurosporenoate acyltransferase CrtO family protein n=1 Tax=Paenibacillus gallinarum TaxID=2762232 RepID=UPI001782FFC8|nr:hypothetical protein [Paenibacillus gallinarum]